MLKVSLACLRGDHKKCNQGQCLCTCGHGKRGGARQTIPCKCNLDPNALPFSPRGCKREVTGLGPTYYCKLERGETNGK